MRERLVADHPAAGGERGGDPGLGLLTRDPDRKVDRAAAAGRGSSIHSNQKRRPAIVRVHEVLVRAVAARLVAEHGPPERHDLGVVGAPGTISGTCTDDGSAGRPGRATAEIRRARSTSRWLMPK